MSGGDWFVSSVFSSLMSLFATPCKIGATCTRHTHALTSARLDDGRIQVSVEVRLSHFCLQPAASRVQACMQSRHMYEITHHLVAVVKCDYELLVEPSGQGLRQALAPAHNVVKQVTTWSELHHNG